MSESIVADPYLAPKVGIQYVFTLQAPFLNGENGSETELHHQLILETAKRQLLVKADIPGNIQRITPRISCTLSRPGQIADSSRLSA